MYKLEANQAITNPHLPRDFFNLGLSEIKREQQRREADVDKVNFLCFTQNFTTIQCGTTLMSASILGLIVMPKTIS